MAEENLDEPIENQDGTGTPGSGGSGDNANESAGQDENYNNLQNRIAGEDDENPWYSASEDKVVTADGQVLLDSAGQPFKTLEAYQAANPKADPAATAKPKTNETTPKAGAQDRSFNTIMDMGEGITPEKLTELGQASSNYSYKNQLAPSIDANLELPIDTGNEDPVVMAQTERDDLVAKMVTPFEEIKQAFLDVGADPATLDSLMAPTIKKQQDAITAHYDKSYQAAMEKKALAPGEKQTAENNAEKVTNNSQANIDKLSKIYFPKAGSDGFFSLLSGHYEINEAGQKEFHRGPAAVVMDLIMNISSNGKAYKTTEDMNKFYTNTFKKVTADNVLAPAIIDIAYKYWLGSQTKQVKKMSFESGQKTEQKNQQKVQKTIKTHPNSFQQPSTDDDLKGAPEMLKTLINAGR